MIKQLIYHCTEYEKLIKATICYEIKTDNGYILKTVESVIELEHEIIQGDNYITRSEIIEKYNQIFLKECEKLLKTYRKEKIRTNQRSKWISGKNVKVVSFYIDKLHTKKLSYEEYKKFRGWK